MGFWVVSGLEFRFKVWGLGLQGLGLVRGDLRQGLRA